MVAHCGGVEAGWATPDMDLIPPGVALMGASAVVLTASFLKAKAGRSKRFEIIGAKATR